MAGENQVSTSTLERAAAFDARKAALTIDRAIALAETLPNDKPDAKLERLITCVMTQELKALVISKEIGKFYDSVPAAEDFAEELQLIAEEILHNNSIVFGPDSSSLVHNIALTADITQDEDILRNLRNALEDTSDYGLDLQKKACDIALSTGESYFAAYRALKPRVSLATTALAQETAPAEDVVDIIRVKTSSYSGVSMLSYNDLYATNTPSTYTAEDVEHDFTYDDRESLDTLLRTKVS